MNSDCSLNSVKVKLNLGHCGLLNKKSPCAKSVVHTKKEYILVFQKLRHYWIPSLIKTNGHFWSKVFTLDLFTLVQKCAKLFLVLDFQVTTIFGQRTTYWEKKDPNICQLLNWNNFHCPKKNQNNIHEKYCDLH